MNGTDRGRSVYCGRMWRLAVLVAAIAVAPASAADIHVPQDVSTLQLAIGEAQPGDSIVLDRGVYPGGNVVPATKHDLTIRGVDRNDVVLDGADTRKNGIVVHADGVSILNMAAHNYLENAFYWQGADRYRASYLTAWRIRGYGIYVEDGVDGILDHDYVTGAADAAYYVGECKNCGAMLTNLTATLSAVGYSGTNATGVVIRDSLWDGNGAGIVPNTYANEALPPQAKTEIFGNTITRSGRARVPIHTALAGFVGVGIGIAGGNENSIHDNRVTGSERYGIALFPTARFVTFNPNVPEPGPPWRPRDNRVANNVVSGSGRADLALASGSGRGNCFSGNSVGTTLPRGLAGCGAAGDRGVASVLAVRLRLMVNETLRRRRPPPYTAMPAPPAQPNMP